MKIEEWKNSPRNPRNPRIVAYVESATIANRGKVPVESATIARIAAACCKAIAFPRSGEKTSRGRLQNFGARLNSAEIEDILGIVAVTLSERGALTAPDADAWRACFRAARAGIGANNAGRLDPADYAAQKTGDRFERPRSLAAINRRKRYIADCLALAWSADTSRKRNSKYAGYLEMLENAYLYMIGRDTGFHNFPDGLSRDLSEMWNTQYDENSGNAEKATKTASSARRVYALRFREYLAEGERLMNLES